MQRSSGSIGSLAAALAKAQGELANPEKSLVGTIRPDDPGGAERQFRYASLSSGLDIVRKVLGHHEIATVQTTSMDQGAGIINLTTMLAHASGEWIASDWPVCAIAETASPQRMGAALTYARRYALFTLVGIAGEDDLDAPDLATPTTRSSGPTTSKGNADRRLNGAQYYPPQRSTLGRDAKAHSQSTSTILSADASAELRDRLIAELDGLVSGDDAALWAHRCLVEKNRLSPADAQRVEEGFQLRLSALSAAADSVPETPSLPYVEPPPPRRESGNHKRKPRSTAIDKSALSLPEPRRVRDRDHVKFVAQQPCLICGRRPSDPHHLRFAQSRALGRKVSDEFTVPLCRGHHREVHRCGDEPTWWMNAAIDPTAAARALWLRTHPLPIAADEEARPQEATTDGVVGSDRSELRSEANA
jgi:hypothetical protein